MQDRRCFVQFLHPGGEPDLALQTGIQARNHAHMPTNCGTPAEMTVAILDRTAVHKQISPHIPVMLIV